jgi:outer membrane lipoprotein-sorting protein
MKTSENNNWLDDALAKAIGSDRRKPDFEKWRQEHPEAVQILKSQATRQTQPLSPLEIGRIIMKSPITKFAAAAVIIVAVVISITVFNKSVPTVIPTASAAQILSEAAQAVSNLRSVHIKARMRTDPYDNFASIDVNCGLVPVELWKQIDNNGITRWRYEKPGRVMVTEGENWDNSVLYVKGSFASKWKGPGGSVGMLKRLLDVDKVLDSEIRHAQEQGSELTSKAGGRNKLVVTVDAKAQGDFTSDWCRNRTIYESDNHRIYTFDAETKLLEGLEIYIYPSEKQKVLIFEVRKIEYNVDIDPKLFTLKIPKNIVWNLQPEVLPDNERYEKMTPKEAAEAFFKACAEGNWDEFLKFWPMSPMDKKLKNYLGGLEIISIGEPFKSGQYPGWFVPYEIKLKNEGTKKWNLAVRNDNPAKRWVVDGGI